MSNRIVAVQKAIYAALDSALDVPVYDRVPPNAPDRYVTIGEDTAVDVSSKDQPGAEITITCHAWDSTHRGRLGVKTLLADMYEALHDAPLTIDGAAVSYIWWEFADSFLDEDGLTYHGVSRYRVRTLG